MEDLLKNLEVCTYLQNFYSLNQDIWIYRTTRVARCESFGRHDCNPDTILVSTLNKLELASWTNRDIVLQWHLAGDPPGCWQGGERDTMCLTRKWFGFVTHQTQICHHMLGFVGQQTQICRRIQHLLVTALCWCAIPIHEQVVKRMWACFLPSSLSLYWYSIGFAYVFISLVLKNAVFTKCENWPGREVGHQTPS